MIDRDDQLGEEAENDDARLDGEASVEDAAADGGEGEGQDEARTELEAEARKQGWKPLEEFKGGRERWTDADEYLKRGDPRQLRTALDDQKRELAKLKSEREAEKRDFEDRLGRLDKMSQTALERQRRQLLGQAKANQRAAAEAGDMEAFDHWQDQEAAIAEDLDKEAKAFAPAKQQREAQDVPDPTIAGWVDSNPAIRYDPVKWNAAVAFFSEATRDLPDGTIDDHLAHVEQRLAQTWPGAVKRRGGNGHAPTQERRTSRAPQTESSGRMAARAPRGKGWSDIPAEEKAIYKDYIKDGLFKDEADAAKAHWS
jgi:hypothetical protein